jgi:hypothetical protein
VLYSESTSRNYFVRYSRHVWCRVMDEARKRVIGIMAAILAARKLAQYEGGTRVPATESAIADSIRWAERIMEEVDRRWPTGSTG